MSDVDTMSLKDMKELIAKAGLTLDGCIEKPDIRQRAREAQAALAAKAAAPPPAARGGSAKQTLGGYSCIVKAPDDVLSGAVAADLAVVVLHGFGASNSDFADVPSLIDPHLDGKRVLYVFPQAPMSAIGAAWWQIDLMGFLTIATAGEAAIAKMIREEPKGLKQAPPPRWKRPFFWQRHSSAALPARTGSPGTGLHHVLTRSPRAAQLSSPGGCWYNLEGPRSCCVARLGTRVAGRGDPNPNPNSQNPEPTLSPGPGPNPGTRVAGRADPAGVRDGGRWQPTACIAPGARRILPG